MPKIFKIIDLFSGCGGSAKGFQQAGFDIRVAVDIDKLASQSFKLNFPKAAVFTSDISALSGRELLKTAEASDGKEIVIIACPPCQGFSTARRKSQAVGDARNLLIYEFLRIVEEIKPLAFVMENVPGLAKGIGKSIFEDIKIKLTELGYQMVSDVVDTADYGVPQRRKRLVLIGVNNHKIELKFPEKTNQDPARPNGNFAFWNTVRNAIADLPALKAGEISEDDSMHRASNLAEINLRRLTLTPHDGGGRSSWPEELVLECHKKLADGYGDIYGRMKWDTPSPTITGGCVMITKGRFGHPEQNRAISLREAARLQTFPDYYQFAGKTGEIAKQLGNAVPPLLAKKIADYLLIFIRKLTQTENSVSLNEDRSTAGIFFQEA